MNEDNGFTLNLEPYCAYCGNFSADVESVEVTSCRDKFPKYLQVITCKNACMCRMIFERMKKQ
jgi:hypothetical protein